MISITYEAGKSQCLHCLKKDKAIYDLRISSLSLSLCLACLEKIKQAIENVQDYQKENKLQ
jgi:copper chaperone CopZ